MTNISFDNPYLLLIALPLLAIVLIPFFIAFRKQNRDKHVITSLILHLCMIVCVALAAGGLSIARVMTETNVYVVADVSYSSQLNLDEVDGYISKVRNKLPKNAKMGVVCFGADAVVHNSLGGKITSVSDAVVDTSATDIYGALDYTADLFAPNAIKHIVLITDGNQTDGADESKLRETIAMLKQKDIYVNAIFVDATLPGGLNEIQVNGVEYVQSTYLGQGTQAIAYIQSNTETTANINVCKGEDVIYSDSIDLIIGENDYEFTLDTSEVGTFEYTLTIANENDDLTSNNEYSFQQTVNGKRKILFVTAEDTKSSVNKIYESDDVEVEFLKYNSSTGRKLKVPTTIEALCQYDQIILSSINIPEQVEGYTQFIDNLNVAVSTYGKSLLTFGDLQLQAKTGEVDDLENLENILPVQYGPKDEDATLYGIVIDVSRSMNNTGKMRTAKDAAMFLINQFKPNDAIIIVSYSAAGETVMSMRNANEIGKEDARQALEKLTPIQGTYVAGGLERMRVEMASTTDFVNKQVILIGDSMQASTTTTGMSAVNVAQGMYADGICVSTLNIDNEEDEGQFQKIANAGKGKYYKGFTEAQLKSVLEGSMLENLMGTVVQTTTLVDIQLPTDDVLDGIDAFEPINWYVCGQAKGDAVVVLTVDYVRPDGTKKKMPLYAYRSCGKGQVGSFNGKFTKFSSNGDGVGTKFLQNMLDTTIPTERNDLPCVYTVETGPKTRVEIIPSNLYQTTEVEVVLTTPDNQTKNYTLLFDGSRHFGALDTTERGNYTAIIKYTVNGQEYLTTTTFTIAYKEEYNRFAGYSAGLLYDLVDERGVVSWDGENIQFKINEDDIEMYVYNLIVPLMIACVVLFVVDVCIRKLRWNDIKGLFVRQKKKGGKR